ncbi:MAG: PQQ-binding-like beta-propeller repeat protein [Thermoplasmata archaeon]|nr:PQQ-binding-like beta-propeller repeat protein [Thermoplasmata archaeon]
MKPRPPRTKSDRRSVLLGVFVVGIAALFLIPSGAYGGGISHRAPGTGTAVIGSGTKSAVPPPITVVKNSKYDWPELHQGPLLNGYATASPLSSLNAPTLGVAWATNAYGSILDSPVVAFDPIRGETLVYVGTETGNVLAVNLANGQIVWGVWLGSPIRSSPLVHNGSLYVATWSNPALLKLDASTGATQCTAILPDVTEATPTIATLPGGVTAVFVGTAGSGTRSGPFVAVDAANCSVLWKFTGYNQPAGSWDSASYVVNATGVPVVIFGTDDPDSSIYALDALTGHFLWRFQCYNPVGADLDVASGVAISPPGKNGFAQGVAYAVNKAGRAYALDLNNGTLIWETNFNALAGASGASRSTPALDGTSIVFGYINGLVNLNDLTGAVNWFFNDSTSTESIASPAIAGGNGHGIAITADIGGKLDVVAMVGGTLLYSYQTGGYITASPAVSDGNILLGSSDGFLYAFAVGGGNHALLPTTAVSYPVQGAMLANPNGNLTIAGNATDPSGVAAVHVAIQSGGPSGRWWDAATSSWSPGPVDDAATLTTPGAAATAWTFSFPVPAGGGTYQAIAYASSTPGQSDLKGSDVDFAVDFSTVGPHLEVSPTFVAPGGKVTLDGGGFGRSVSVSISLLGKTLATVTSSTNGSLPSTPVVIPLKALFGPSALVASSGSSGKSCSVAITIANNWDQLGYSAGHTGFEPNDEILNNLIFPGGDNWVKLAWHFAAPASINASPAVADGDAYVADTIGNLYSVDVHNGGLLWNFTLTSKAAIEGTPAVDPVRGIVFVGADDGTVDAINTTNGSLIWSTSLGGKVWAPVLSNGDLFVTSSLGAVAELAESSGSVTWSIATGKTITSAPSLNATADLLVVGESNGDVVGMNTTSGTTLWTYVTGGAVTASAMVTGGVVYVGSNDHKFYALSQKTGTKKWDFVTGGAVQETGTLDNQGLLYIGSNDGRLYVLRVSTGLLDFNFSIGSPIVGVSTAKGVAVYEDAAGTIGAEKTYLDGGGWKFLTGAGLVTAPVLLDGTVYVTGQDGFLYAFTSNGQAPV